jgi:hypothetical protein
MITLHFLSLPEGYIQFKIGKKKLYTFPLKLLKDISLLYISVEYNLSEGKNDGTIDIKIVPERILDALLECLHNHNHLCQVILSLTEESNNKLPYDASQIIFYCDYLGVSKEAMTSLIKPLSFYDYNQLIYSHKLTICENNYEDEDKDEDNNEVELVIGECTSPTTEKVIPVTMNIKTLVEQEDFNFKNVLVEVSLYLHEKIVKTKNGKSVIHYFDGLNKDDNSCDIIIESKEIIKYGTFIFLKLEYIMKLKDAYKCYSDYHFNILMRAISNMSKQF